MKTVRLLHHVSGIKPDKGESPRAYLERIATLAKKAHGAAE